MKAWFEANRGAGYQPTPVEQLAYVGERGLGALTYHPVIDDYPKKLLRKLDLHYQEKLSTTNQGAVSADFIEQMRQGVGSVGGRYPKIICAEDPATGMLFEDDARLERNFRRWIIKFAQPDSPYASQTEFALSNMARAAGLTVPSAKLFHSEDKGHLLTHFGIERFDWKEGERIHVASLAALTGRPASDTSLDYRDFLGFTHELTRDMQQVEEVFRRMVFNVAVCNSDDHAKNHAFCYRERVWTLSPAYDITFCPGTPGAPAVRAMPVGGQASDVSLAQIMRLGDEAGLKKAACFSMIERIVEIASSAETYLEEAEIDKKERKEIGAYFEETMKRLRHSKGKVR
jgi:serine/threonine-protein kinase HipA